MKFALSEGGGMGNGMITLALEGRKPERQKTLDLKLILELLASVPALTITLIILNLTLFVLMLWVGGSISNDTLLLFGAQFGPLVKHGEYWRLLTSAFLHIGFLHLFCNMWALFVLGRRLEPVFGSLRFGIIYFVSALTGSLLGLLAMPLGVAAGASGAIFGIAGAMLVLGTTDPQRVPDGMGKAFGPGILPFLVYNLAFGAFYNLVHTSGTSALNLAAHVGGALGGIVCAVVLKPHSEKPRATWLAVAGSTAAMLGSFLFVLHSAPARGLTVAQLWQNQKLKPVWRMARAGKAMQAQAALAKFDDSAQNSPDFHILRAIFLDTQQQSAAALSEYQHAVRLAPNYPVGHRALGMALLRRGRADEAIAEQREAVRLDDTSPNSHLFLGQVLLAENMTAEATDELRIATQLNPQWSEPHRLLALALKLQGKPAEAASEHALAVRLAEAAKTPAG
jgi:rhomboid protease GluP